jgi:hypothetical protein
MATQLLASIHRLLHPCDLDEILLPFNGTESKNSLTHALMHPLPSLYNIEISLIIKDLLTGQPLHLAFNGLRKILTTLNTILGPTDPKYNCEHCHPGYVNTRD